MMIDPGTRDSDLMALVRTIVSDDAAAALQVLAHSPVLARARLEEGATRRAAKEHYLDAIEHYVYAGDTALHVAAAAYRTEIVRKLIEMSADVRGCPLWRPVVVRSSAGAPFHRYPTSPPVARY